MPRSLVGHFPIMLFFIFWAAAGGIAEGLSPTQRRFVIISVQSQCAQEIIEQKYRNKPNIT